MPRARKPGPKHLYLNRIERDHIGAISRLETAELVINTEKSCGFGWPGASIDNAPAPSEARLQQALRSTWQAPFAIACQSARDAAGQGARPCIAGSTRMNAGTSQRITLTLLSTLLMIRLGRVYRGLMVEVQATNLKLTQRKQRMLGFLTGRSQPEIDRALEVAKGNVKLAVLVRGCDVHRAKTFLQETNGHLREAIALADTQANQN